MSKEVDQEYLTRLIFYNSGLRQTECWELAQKLLEKLHISSRTLSKEELDYLYFGAKVATEEGVIFTYVWNVVEDSAAFIYLSEDNELTLYNDEEFFERYSPITLLKDNNNE